MEEATEFAEALARPREVRSLRVERKEMVWLPAEIGSLTALTHLSVARNRLAGLPAEIGRLKRLEVLDASRNRLKRLPEELGRLRSLRVLRLGVNQLTALPDLGGLSSLEELEIGPNPPLILLPSWLWRLTSLERLGLFRIPLARIPSELAKLRNLQSLEIGEPGELLEHDRPIPDAVWSLERLRALSIFGSSDATLSPHVGNLSALEDLSIVEARLSRLPNEIGNLSNLRSLSLDANRLERLPDSLGQLQKLEHLSLTGNPLAQGEIERLRSRLPRTEIEVE